MSSTARAETMNRHSGIRLVVGLVWLVTAVCQAASATAEARKMIAAQASSSTLSDRKQAIVPIAAFAASGDLARLGEALNRGLDAGLAASEIKEVLVQVYAYAGFPRSLNALSEFMTVLGARKRRGIADAPGREPNKAIPTGHDLLVAGAANQTRLLNGPAAGPLFDFAPAIDEYLKTHLFGDIFERDNLDWQSREIATVSMLSVIAGAESQLQAHVRISMNVGISADQLRQLGQVLADRVDGVSARRLRDALAQHLDAAKGAR